MRPAGEAGAGEAGGLRAAGFPGPRGVGTCYVESGSVLFRGPDTVRGPDVSFLSRERAAQVKGRRGFVPFAPELAVEIRSPENTLAELSAKARDYLEAGTRLVWIGDPPSHTAQGHEPGKAPRLLSPAAGLALAPA